MRAVSKIRASHKKNAHPLFKDKRLPAVPPCLMQNAFSLQSAITLLARYAGIASQLLKNHGFSYPALPAFFHLALGGPFTETAFIRIAPPRTL